MNAVFFKESLRLWLLISVAVSECGHSQQFTVLCGLSHYPHCTLRRANSGNQLSQTLHSRCRLPLLALLRWQICMHHINLISISIFHRIQWLSPHWTSLVFTMSLLHPCTLSSCWWGGLEAGGCPVTAAPGLGAL